MAPEDKPAGVVAGKEKPPSSPGTLRKQKTAEEKEDGEKAEAAALAEQNGALEISGVRDNLMYLTGTSLLAELRYQRLKMIVFFNKADADKSKVRARVGGLER